MRHRLQKFSYRFAEQVLNSKLSSKQEIDEVLLNSSIRIETLSRANLKKIHKVEFGNNWELSLTYEKVFRYIPQFKSAIQILIFVIGIDL